MAEDIFPVFDDEDLIEEFYTDDDLEEDVDARPPTPYGFSWKFDFGAGDIYLTASGDTVKIENQATVMEWAQHAISIPRGEDTVYFESFGTDIENLIGTTITDSYTVARVQEEIEEILTLHDRVLSVNATNVFSIEDSIYAYINIATDDGEDEETVIPINEE